MRCQSCDKPADSLIEMKRKMGKTQMICKKCYDEETNPGPGWRHTKQTVFYDIPFKNGEKAY